MYVFTVLHNAFKIEEKNVGSKSRGANPLSRFGVMTIKKRVNFNQND
jgi:hypothetical protein